MFQVIFGLFWLLFTAFFTFISYAGGTTISVNGQIVSQEEFNAMLFPKIFLGIFWAIGIIMIIWGLKKIIRNYKTDTYGEVCYGKIINIFNSGTYVNNIPELKARVSVYIESLGTLEEIEEVIGLATKKKYNIGDYIEGKYYNGDINIESYIPETMIPSHLRHTFDNVLVSTSENTIIVDGVEYIRKDSIK